MSIVIEGSHESGLRSDLCHSDPKCAFGIHLGWSINRVPQSDRPQKSRAGLFRERGMYRFRYNLVSN